MTVAPRTQPHSGSLPSRLAGKVWRDFSAPT